MMRGVRLVGVSVALASAACSLFVPTGGLVGGDDEDPHVDPATGGDAGRREAGMVEPGDAGTVARPGDVDADAPPAGFCDEAALFCTDVEEPGALGLWTRSQAAPGTSIVVESGLARSPSHALLVTTTRTAEVRSAVLEVSLPRVWKSFRIRFAMRFDEVMLQAGDRGTHVFAFSVQLSAAALHFSMEALADRRLSFYASSAPAAKPFESLATPLTYGAWHTYDVEIALGQNAVRIHQDGVLDLERADVAFPAPEMPTAVTLQLGAMGFNTPHPGVAVRFDDVRVDTLP